MQLKSITITCDNKQYEYTDLKLMVPFVYISSDSRELDTICKNSRANDVAKQDI